MNKTPANRTITAEYLEKDQDWGQESTTYWFLIDGESMGETFDSEIIGIVDSGPMPMIVIEADDGALVEGMRRAVVLHECSVREHVALMSET